MNKLKAFWIALIDAWQNRANLGEQKRNEQELDFLPAALEVLERPASPLGKFLGRTLMALVTIGIIWACVGNIDITAVAEGKIISSSRIKDIQPLEKGVVKAIYVKEGELVKAGQALVELDQTLSGAEQTRTAQELHFAQTNWLSEGALLKALQRSIAPQLPQADTHPIAAALTPSERSIQGQLLHQKWLEYRSRVSTLESQKKEQESALQSVDARIVQLQQTLPLASKRAGAIKRLVEQKNASEMEYLEVEQSRIEQQQTLLSYQAQRKQSLAAIETAAQQLNILKAETISQALTRVDELQRQVQSLTQELAKANDIKAKQILYAPVDGNVQQLAVHTVGGVVTEAQVLMQLVPHNDYLEVEATLENKDIGFVHIGQMADIKINTFNFTKYGAINAEVVGVAADAVVDEVKGLVYKLRLKMSQKTMSINGREITLLPGMSVMAEVKTGKRKIIEFVLSPLLRKANESAGER